MNNMCLCRFLLLDQQGTERSTAAGETGLYGAELDVEDLGDFFVGEAFDLTEDDYRPVGLRELTESDFELLACLILDGLLVGRVVGVGEGLGETGNFALGIVVGIGAGVDGDFL